MNKVIFSIFIFAVIFSQNERGLPFITNYSRHIYKGAAVSDAITQDKNGTLFFGNMAGLYSFNGSKWTKVQIPNIHPIKSLAIDSNDRIYIGGKRNFGYLEKDDEKKYLFTSLSDRLDSANQNFRYIWYINFSKDTVFFQTNQFLFYYVNDSLHTYKTSTRLHSLNKIKNKLYTREYDYGLKYWVNDSLYPMEKGDFFHGSSPYLMLERKSGSILYGNRRDGIVEEVNGKLIIKKTSLTEQIRKSLIYRGKKTSDELYAIATLGNGLYVIDENIDKIYHLNKKNGLISSDIKYIFKAHDKSLWLATSKGIARVEHQSPFRLFDSRLGVEGTVNRIIRFKNTLYTSQNNGVSFWNGKTFQNVEGISNLTFNFEMIGAKLYVAAQNGIYEIRGGKAYQFSTYSSYDISTFLNNKGVIAAGRDGLALLYEKKLKQIPQINYELIKIIKQSETHFWLVSNKKIVLIEIDNNLNIAIKKTITKYEKSVSFSYYTLLKVNSNIYYNTPNGLKIYDSSKNSFLKENQISKFLPNNGIGIYLLEKDSLGNYWFNDNNNTTLLKKLNGQEYTYENQNLKRIDNFEPFYAYYSEENGTVWLGGPEGVIKVNPNLVNQNLSYQKTLIHSLSLKKDSTILLESNNYLIRSKIPYDLNTMRIQFSVPAYDEAEKNQFQYYLEGESKEWSSWKHETFVNFSNLFEGAYTFRVKAKDIYGNIYPEAKLDFTISPPYYRSYIAYFIYFTLAVLLIYVIVKIRTEKIQREKEQLEIIVKERTSELSIEKEKVEEQAAKLLELDRVKTNFFSNISHEFRTPLTLILGPIQNLIKKTADKKILQDYSIIRENASRLLYLINQLLDISKLENDQFPLSVSKQSLNQFIKGIVETFKPLTNEKRIKLIYSSKETIKVFFDRNILERVILNLLSNAIKFTDYDGEITISN